MNMDTYQGKWSSVNDRLGKKWPKLNADDKQRIERDGDELAPVLIERCQMTQDQAQREAKQFFESCGDLRGTTGSPERKASSAPSSQRGSSAPSKSSQGPQRGQSGSQGGRSEGGREAQGGGQRSQP